MESTTGELLKIEVTKAPEKPRAFPSATQASPEASRRRRRVLSS
jgi:hypothetical protein